MLPPKELARLRADLEAVALPSVAVLLSLSQASDGQGGFTDAWAASGTVACRLDNSSGQRATVGQSLRPYSAWVLTVPHDAGLTTAHRVEIGDYTYSVIAVSDAPSLPACQRAHVERI